jgi:hypothetical protein
MKNKVISINNTEFTRIRAFMSINETDSVSGTEVRNYLASNGIIELAVKFATTDDETGDTEEDLMYYVSSNQYESVRDLMKKYYS